MHYQNGAADAIILLDEQSKFLKNYLRAGFIFVPSQLVTQNIKYVGVKDYTSEMKSNLEIQSQAPMAEIGNT